MRRGVSLLVTLALVVLGLGVITTGTAQAEPAECEVRDNRTGQCLIYVQPPPPEYPPPGGGEPDPGDPGPVTCWDPLLDREVTCVIGDWYWSYEWACHTKLTEPQPPYSDDVWPSGTTEGAIYDCGRGITLDDPFPVDVVQRWSPIPPWGAPPDPEELAQDAIAAMNLRAIQIGSTPYTTENCPQREPCIGIIGYPQYLWVADEGPSTWGPITRTASAGPYSVTATAQVDRIEWDMGNGDVVTCTTPGIPYHDSYEKEPSPDCGYAYQEDGYYTLTATSYWVVEWAGMGQSGTIDLDLAQTHQIVMGEVQVITQ